MTTVLSPNTLHHHREQLCEWVKANGLDPHVIPLTHPLRVEEGRDGPTIRYQAYVLTEDGHKQVDPNQMDEALTTERTAPCTVPPPHLGTPTPHPEHQAST